MARTFLLASAGTLLIHLTAWSAPAPNESNKPAQALEIRLVTPDYPIFPGDFIGIQFVMKNVGRDTLTMLVPLDGCEMGKRAVRYSWTSSDPNVIKDRYYGGYCGSLNPLKEEDFFKLAPGEEINCPKGCGYLVAQSVGECEVTLTYEFDPKRPDRGLNKKPDLEKRLQEVTPLKVTSAPLKVRVRPLPDELAKHQAKLTQIHAEYNKASQVHSQAYKTHQAAATPEQKKIAYEALQIAEKQLKEIQARMDQIQKEFQDARLDYFKRWREANR